MMFEHDFYIAYFYFKTKEYWAAEKRLLKMVPEYPYIREIDKVLLYLAKTYLHLNEEGEAKKTLMQLRNDYPQSKYMDEVERLLDRSLDGEDKKNGN